MPKTVNFQANERVDKTDLDAATASFARDANNLNRVAMLLDNQSRIARGFRVELPNQNSYPGRLVVHGGIAFDKSGRILFTEDQDKISRTVTLEGANTTFYIELEFTEADSDVDSRAFWDPTVDQGTDPSGDERPDGQEFSNNIATRKNPDWKIVTPVSTSSFQRDSIPTSTRVPLIKLKTDASNKITATVNPGLTTEKFATTLLQQVSTMQLRVQNPYFLPAVGNSIKVSEGASSEETVTVSKIDYDAGLVTTSTMYFAHQPGDIIRVATASEPDFVIENEYGRYRRTLLSNQIDYKDKIWQGDEKHGEALAAGHSGITITDRSDVNLQSLKDQIDFMAAQIEEMKWGHMDPYLAKDSSRRYPPGTQAVTHVTNPRYFDRVAGIMGGRFPTITVGDGVNSWGDVNSQDAQVIFEAIDALPASGGRVFVKRGTYTNDGSCQWSNSKDVFLEGEPGTVISNINGNYIYMDSAAGVTWKNIAVQDGDGASTVGLYVDCNPSLCFNFERVVFTNCQFSFDAQFPTRTSFTRCLFSAASAAMASLPLWQVASSGSRVMHGVFEDVEFFHLSSDGTGKPLIDLTNSTATNPANGVIFKNCVFFSLNSGLLTYSMNFGTGPHNVTFDTCEFGCGAALAHIFYDEGTDLKIINCDNVNAWGLVVAHNSSMIDIRGNRGVDQGYSSVVCYNCSQVKIRDNIFRTNSGIPLFFKAIHIYADLDVEDYVISGNTIIGNPAASYNNTLGIHFDITDNSVDVKDLKITGNTFQELETGMFFAHSTGTGGAYKGVVISKNVFIDEDYSTQKIGILGGSASSLARWVVSDNVISGLRPSTSSLVAGVGRYGMLFQSTSNTEMTITGNTISNVGHSSYPVPAAGIASGQMSESVIANNQISNVAGDFAYGIQATYLGNLSNSTVSGNVIGSIYSTAFFSCGLAFYGTLDVSITGNTIGEVTSAISSAARMIQMDSGAGRYTINTTIQGNILNAGGPTDVYGIVLSGEQVVFSTISGNTIKYVREGIYVSVGSGTPHLENLTIMGNNINVSGSSLQVMGIRVDAAAATYLNKGYVNITGNTVSQRGSSGSSAGIYVNQMDRGMHISQNQMEITQTGGTANYSIWVENSRMFQIIHNYIFNILSTDAMIKADHASNNVFIVAFNIVDAEASAPAHTSIDTNGAGTPGIVGMNLVDVVPSGSAGHYNIGTGALATGSAQFIQY